MLSSDLFVDLHVNSSRTNEFNDPIAIALLYRTPLSNCRYSSIDSKGRIGPDGPNLAIHNLSHRFLHPVAQLYVLRPDGLIFCNDIRQFGNLPKCGWGKVGAW